MSTSVRWAELLPHEFEQRLADHPVVYLPMGLCEPHGEAAAFGLDTLKADYICDRAATRFGGIVAPTQGYHIHESGYHAAFLREAVGEDNPRLGGLPPDVILRTLLYQFRAFANAGFRTFVVVSGHNGAQADLRRVAAEFMRLARVRIVVQSDPELVKGQFPGDHAGRFELSQLLHVRADLVDLGRVDPRPDGPYGRLAQGVDARTATAQYGREIIDQMIIRVGQLIEEAGVDRKAHIPFLTFAEVEAAWSAIEAARDQWVSHGPTPG